MPNSTNSTFPQKLFILLENEKNDIITWLHHGLAFKVIEPDRFIEEVMPKYFRHTKMTSFQRQLNLYGFRRVNKGEDQGAYFHPKFQRKQKEMAIEIRRLPTKLSPFQNETDLPDMKFARPCYASDFNTHEINRSLPSVNEDSINIKSENLGITDINYQFPNNHQENMSGFNQIPRSSSTISPEARFTTGYGSGIGVSSNSSNHFLRTTTTTTANSTVTTTKVLDDQLVSNLFGYYSTPTTSTRSYSSSFSQPKIVEVDGIPADQFLNKLPKLLADISSQLTWQNAQNDFNLFDEVSSGVTNMEATLCPIDEMMQQDDLISKYINNEIDLTSNLLNHNKTDVMQNIMDFNSSSYSIISSIPAVDDSQEDVLPYQDIDVDMNYLDSLFSTTEEADFFHDTFSDSILV